MQPGGDRQPGDTTLMMAPADPRWRAVAVTAVLLVVAHIAVVALLSGHERALAAQSLAVVRDVLGVVTLLWAWRRSGRIRRHGWLLLACGLGWAGVVDGVFLLGLWAGWSRQQLAVGEFAFLGVYPLLVTGILSLAARPPGPRERRRIWLDLAILASAVFLVEWMLVAEPIFAQLSTDPLIAGAGLIFPVIDIVLLWTAMRLIASRPIHLPALCLFLLATAAVVQVVADIWLASQMTIGRYDRGDPAWIAVGIATALLTVAGARSAAQPMPDARLRGSTDGLLSPRSLMLAGTGALTALVITAVHLWGQIPPVTPGLAALTLLLVMVRVAVVLSDAFGLQGQLRAAKIDLEQRVAARTAELDRTVTELRTALAAVEAARLAEAATRREAEALRDTATAIGSTLDLDRVLEAVLDHAGRVVAHDAASYMKVRDGIASFPRHRGYAERGAGEWLDRARIPVSELGPLLTVYTEGRNVVVPDALAVVHPPEFAWMRSWVAVPMKSHGRVEGIMCAVRAGGAPFVEADAVRLAAFADQAGNAIAHARLFAETHDRAARLELVAELAASISLQQQVGDLLQSAVEGASRLLQVEQTAIALLDHGGERLTVVADRPGPGEHSAAGTVLHLRDHPDLAAIIRRRQRIIVADPRADQRLSGLHAAHGARATTRSSGTRSHPRLRAQLAQPLAVGNAVFGLLVAGTTDPGRTFPEGDQALAETVAALVAVRLDQVRRLAAEHDARRTAEAASSAKSAFLANTSHELRTPLNGILGALDLVLDGFCKDGAEIEDLLRTAHLSGTRLLETINGLLDLSKIEAGRMDVRREPVDLAEAVAEVSALLAPRALAKGLTLVSAPPPPALPMASGDPGLIRQILINLMGNSVKFTDAGTVTLRLGVAGEWLRIEVIDTGPGISRHDLDRLFTPFVQGDAANQHREGTGLGLALARAMAERMGGSLHLASQGPGLGATATLTLPIAVAEAAGTAPAPAGTSLPSAPSKP